MDGNELAQILREEASDALKSSMGDGDYNNAFYVASIVLRSLADRLDRALTKDASDG